MSVNFGIPREVVLFPGNSGKCRYIRRWKFPKIQTRIFNQTESAATVWVRAALAGGHCVVFLGKTLNSHSASLTQEYKWVPANY